MTDYGVKWVHESNRAWVTFFPEGGIFGRPAHFQAYIVIGALKDPANPAGSNNRRLGREAYGFKTLDEAKAAIYKEMLSASERNALREAFTDY